jgi:hypothetical protein
MQPWKIQSCLASLNVVRLIGAREACAAGTEARGGVTRAGDAIYIN